MSKIKIIPISNGWIVKRNGETAQFSDNDLALNFVDILMRIDDTRYRWSFDQIFSKIENKKVDELYPAE